MSEVVVVGYGRTKKDDLTGSVTAIKPDELSKGITNNAQDMLVGKVAGVDVITAGVLRVQVLRFACVVDLPSMPQMTR